ncbi:S41 family peptidase [Paenibacillus hunanensis]|uniref:S41 family peptidase n=1 Tax=Paenibacillus hunanensis TaxID=539262 RepID=UPI0020260BA2|nr:S41 family peptidase [Paenibacillus hunanensis]MCL9662811.1 S41 family peptidase [Paenibacillus hunanensis]
MMRKRTVALLVVAMMVLSSVLTLAVVNLPSFVQRASMGQGVLGALSGGGLNDQEKSKLSTVASLIESNYYQNVDESKLVDGAINGMMEALGDPYSSYMDTDTASQFSESIAGSFTGIGAEVSQDNGNVVIVAPIKGSPAEKAGLRAKDIIVSVNGEKLSGSDLNAAVAKIRGEKGSVAQLEVQRAGSKETMTFKITRDDIAMETVYARMTGDKIGVIEITQFSLNTAERFKQELTKLQSQGMKGLVIDVRNNPGGVLSVVEDMASQLIAKGKPIVQIEDRKGQRQVANSSGQSVNYPIAVVTNGGSASASEILAGALKQSAGATLYGETTYGKGTVQTSMDNLFNDGSLIKITIAKWLTPNGDWIHKKGIKPDVAVAPPDYYTVTPLNTDTVLAYDMNNDNVKNAQIMLAGLGYKVDRKDGYFDRSTETEVRAFQAEQKLEQTGKIDAKTAAALEAALIKHIQDPQYDVQLNKAIAGVEKQVSAAK